MIVSFVKVKLFALILGPIGFGVISQFSNFQIFLTGVICLGIPVGLTTLVAQRYQKKNFYEIQSLIVYLGLITFVFALIISITLIFLSKHLSSYLVNDESGYSILIILMLMIPFLIQYSLLEAYLKGTDQINLIVKINLINSFLSLIIIFPLTYYFSVYGAAIFMFISGLLPLFIFMFLAKFDFRKLFKIKIEFKPNLLKNIIKIGIVSLASSFLFQLSMIQLRKFIIDNYGIQSAGIYQTVLGLSTSYFVIIYTYLSLYSLPQFSKIENNIDIIKELNNNLRFLLFLIIPMAMLLLSFKNEYLIVFYSSEFLKASDYFYYQILGDIFRVLAALFGLWLIPKVKIFALLSIDLTLNVLLLTLPIVSSFLFHKNLIYISMIYLIAFMVHFSLYFIYSKIKLGFKLEKKTIKSIVLAVIISTISIAANLFLVEYSKIIVIVILLIGTYLIFDKDEKKKIYTFVNLIINRPNL